MRCIPIILIGSGQAQAGSLRSNNHFAHEFQNRVSFALGKVIGCGIVSAASFRNPGAQSSGFTK